MKKILMFSLLFSLSEYCFSQSITKTYSGPYEGENNEQGKAVYGYYEKDEERIYHGAFSYTYTSSLNNVYAGTTTIKGTFEKGKRTGQWLFAYKGKGGLNTWTTEEQIIDKDNYKITEDQNGKKTTVYNVKKVKHNHATNVAATNITMTVNYTNGYVNGLVSVNENGQIKAYKFVDGKLADGCTSNFPVDDYNMLHGKITVLTNANKYITEYYHGFQISQKTIDQSTGKVITNKKLEKIDSTLMDSIAKYHIPMHDKLKYWGYYTISEKCQADLPFKFRGKYIPGHEPVTAELIKYSVIAGSSVEYNVRIEGNTEYIFTTSDETAVKISSNTDLQSSLKKLTSQ